MSGLEVNVVANASGGRALRAFKVLGSNAPVIGPHVLETPQNIEIRGSLDPQMTEELSFIDIEEYKDFFKKVSTEGWRAAVNVEVGWRLGSLKLGGKGKKEQEHKVVAQHTTKVRNVVVTQCLYVPMKCFQIPQPQMFLTKAAIADAKAVTKEEEAVRFLAKYNTHVYTGLYHIGGIFMREVSISSSEEVQAGFLVEKALLEVGASAEFSHKGAVDIKVDGNFSYVTTQDVSYQVSNDVKFLKSQERIHVWGATSASNKEDFMTKLEADPSKWAIIDKAFDQQHDLIGIWEIMKKHEELKAPAKLIEGYYERMKSKQNATSSPSGAGTGGGAEAAAGTGK